MVILLCQQGLQYTDYIHCRGVRFPHLTKKKKKKKKKKRVSDTKLHLIVRLKFWRSEECIVPFRAITLRSTLTNYESNRAV